MPDRYPYFMAKSAQKPGTQAVLNAVRLLRLQATIWALLSAGIVAEGSAYMTQAPGKDTTTAVVVTVILALVTGTFAAVKFWLASRLPRGTHRTRETVVAVEMLMAYFAVLVLLALAVSVFGLFFSPPVIIGGIMSSRVAGALKKPPAQLYFDASADPQSAIPQSPGVGGPAQFWGCLVTA
jgi:hypothetical protein